MDRISFLLQQNYIETQISKKLDLALSVHGISFTEFIVIYYLNEAPEDKLSRSALGSKVALTASGITRLLLPLEKIGLVEKATNPRDARQSLIVLTKSGEQLVKDATVTVEHAAEMIFSLLTDDETATLGALLNKLKV